MSHFFASDQIRSDESLSHVQLFATPWIEAHQASLSITNSQRSLRLASIESVMSSNHLILCHPLLLPPSIFPSIRVFSNESVHCVRWPKYWVGYVSLNFCLINEDYSLLLFSFLFVYIILCLLTGSLVLEYIACNILTFWTNLTCYGWICSNSLNIWKIDFIYFTVKCKSI